MWTALISLCLALSGKPERKAASRRRPAFRRPLLEALEDRTLLSAYVVTTTADSGPGSLRDAIYTINADTTGQYLGAHGVDEIDFAITAASDTGGGFDPATGVANIQPQSALPAITTAVFMDGASRTNIDGGNSPAFTVSSGNVIVRNIIFSTATDAPTILVTGGRLTLRNDVIQESTGGDDAAIAIAGGTVDLGTVQDPGGNVLNVNTNPFPFNTPSPGRFLDKATSSLVPEVGDTFEVNGAVLPPRVSIRMDQQQLLQGDLDPSFGTGGIQTTNLGSPDDEANNVFPLADGQLIVAGSTLLSSGDYALTLSRYEANGSLDTSYGDGGTIVVTSVASPDGVPVGSNGLACEPDGSVLIFSFNEVTRYNADGSLDTHFGTNGIATVFLPLAGGGIALQPDDGKILLTGSTLDSTSPDYDPNNPPMNVMLE
jgi:uncharacterized delta-60 repeat protein